MAVPKKRTSKSQKGQRRAHDFIKTIPATQICQSCGALKRMHHICMECGTYRGAQVLPRPASASSEGAAASESEA